MCKFINEVIAKYNKTYHGTIKSDLLLLSGGIEYGAEKGKDPKFKVGDHFRITKYKKVITKGYTHNWSEEVFVKKVCTMNMYY